MSEPLYSIGQDVAVCTADLDVVIPQTTVVDCTWRNEGLWRDGTTGKLELFSASYSYRVADGPLSTIGNRIWYQEHCLRPILPGEYDEDTQDLAAPVDGVSA